MQGLHPPNIRYLKPYRYTVQSSDDVGTIAGYFGMPMHKWPELCGANCHKRMSMEAPTGFKHRCFEKLTSGEQLCIPSYWKDPDAVRTGGVGSPIIMPSGTVGAVPLDLLAQFQTAVRSAIGTALPSAVVPQPQSLLDSLLAVIYSWWKHLGKGNTPTLPTPPSLPTTPQEVLNQIGNGVVTADNWGLLFNSANEFLKVTGIGQANGSAPQVQNIPWSDIPWDQMTNAWSKVSPSVWNQVTGIMRRKSGGMPTTPPILLSMAPLPPSGLPNFLDAATWSSPSMAPTPFEHLNWSDQFTEVAKDPRFAKCVISNPGNVDKLKDCPQCWESATIFVDRLCGSGEPCDCDEPSEPGGEPTTPPVVKKDEPAKKGMSSMMIAGIVLTAALGILVVADAAGDK